MSAGESKPGLWKKKLPAWLLAPIMIVLCVALTPQCVLRQRHNGTVSHAKGNTRSLGYVLFNFESDFSSYPNVKTAQMLRERYPDQAHLLKTESSNDFMRQMMIAKYVDIDGPFKAGVSVDKPEWLGSGECKYAYVIWDEIPNDEVPLLIWPVEPGQKKLNLAYNGRAVMLMTDMSVKVFRADDQFFDWSQPHWGGQKPRIAWPE